MPKIIHFRKNCIGCHGCVDQAPQYWNMDEQDGLSTLQNSIQKKDVYQRDIVEFEIEQNKDAALVCPVKIIKIYDDNGKDITHE